MEKNAIMHNANETQKLKNEHQTNGADGKGKVSASKTISCPSTSAANGNSISARKFHLKVNQH